MKKDRLFLVKLGGSLITDKTKPYTPRIDVIRRLLGEIKEAISMERRLILGHGGGSFPHVSASKYHTYRGFVNEKSLYGMTVVHRDASRLNSIIIEELLEIDVPALPIQPSSITIAEDSRIIEMYIEPIKLLLGHNILPVVYGDVALDLEKGCCILSTEEIFRFLSIKLKEEYDPYIVMCEVVDGIYSKDPIKYPDAEFIPRVTRDNYLEVKEYLSSSHGIDVTGGMLHKVEVLFELAKEGISSIILNGLIQNNLKSFLEGKHVKGTIIQY
jgi:isopentenyl phosphate kinase